ncbi:hypothetical protein LOK74_00770 [Brevibacillus humidisoli]|uniref:Spy/CpxP family protein refolding chaperone n=1 Tax=Brevibacillus humidisoli TaxID=2895522 RepID=UPI001E5AEA28|nr:hypothetical protein [Brevibacillus humidisoli]UFJ41127.1 hypothetical protein LOK74_00770 [Brevibacillus humidisoli]
MFSKTILLTGLLSSVTVLSIGCSAAETTEPAVSQPYTDLQSRTIKALSAEKIEGLLKGAGLQYALSAELNHYPGPKHTLDFGKELGLHPDQESAIKELADDMTSEAKTLGKRLVELESQLDKSFASGWITEEELTAIVNQIAMVEGQLRTVHLQTHLKTKEILSPEQVARYDVLRGYIENRDASTQGKQHQHDH